MSTGIHRTDPGVRVLEKGLLEQVDAFDRLLLELFRFEVDAHLLRLLKNVRVPQAIERHTAHHHREHDHSCAPYVALMVVRTIENFWSHVVRGTVVLVEALALGPVAAGARAEVDDLDNVGAIAVEQNVFWLDVSMHEFVLMHVIEPHKNLVENSRNLPLSPSLPIFSPLVYFLEEFTSTTELLDYVDALVVLEDLVDLNDVRVVHLLEQRNLLLVLLPHARLQQSLLKDLNCPPTARLLVLALKHLRMGPLPEEVLPLVLLNKVSVVFKAELHSVDEHSLRVIVAVELIFILFIFFSFAV
eukprot:CAMPEP_0170489678 /NCGR_PEP_ID=MMETSP0208-20121228/7988_1 /TAXON_ID=197538 /ORGANISM="Strombidium inclinatum, Strain S3" /LENGTH=300 /DNA_ID=CAMNT_0010764699 /DNA_START=535 /DNA_END=1434 /DNA_ORIENTATION=+